MIKTRKVTQFHIDIVRQNLDKVLSGEINTGEIIELINTEARAHNQAIIKDRGTIKRIMAIILEDKPEVLQEYYSAIKYNTGRRSPRVRMRYRDQETDFTKRLIEEYLPKILTGEITYQQIEDELHTTHQLITRVIENYYKRAGDEEGLQAFITARRRNAGVSLEERKEAREKRERVRNMSGLVSNKIFLTLTPEEQDEQILMKIMKTRLQEEESRQATALMSEEATLTYIEKIKNYFRSKNNSEDEMENFSEQDIRHIIFLYPSIIGRTEDTLDKKIEALTSYDEIDEETAYGMIKTFPAVIGYSVERTKTQLDLLQKENLIDYAIVRPSGLMRSPQLLYALIEFAKERHNTDNLDNINLSNIFMTSSALKRLHGFTTEELKQRYPYINPKLTPREVAEYSENVDQVEGLIREENDVERD